MIAQVSQQRSWSQIIARAWADDDFKRQLASDPRGVLAEHGIDVPADVEIKVVEDTSTVRHLVLPPPPSDELTDEELVGSSTADSFSIGCFQCGRCGCGGCD